MNLTRHAALGAAAAAELTRAALRSSQTFADGVEVDEAKGIIRNAAVMKIGEAEGHGFSIDATTLSQVAALINANAAGVKMRFKHPQLETDPITGDAILPDDLGDVIGRVLNARVEGDAVRADIHLGDYAEVLPGLGNVKTYLLRRAKSDPTGLGLSAVIAFEPEPVLDEQGNAVAIVARVGAVDAVDFVGRGAATPNGLLSAQTSKPTAVAALCGGHYYSESTSMNDLFKRILLELGLPYDSSDEAGQAFFDALTDAMKEEIQTRIKAVTAAVNVDLNRAAKEAAAKVAPMSAKAVASAARAALSAKTKPAPASLTAALAKYRTARDELRALLKKK